MYYHCKFAFLHEEQTCFVGIMSFWYVQSACVSCNMTVFVAVSMIAVLHFCSRQCEFVHEFACTDYWHTFHSFVFSVLRTVQIELDSVKHLVRVVTQMHAQLNMIAVQHHPGGLCWCFWWPCCYTHFQSFLNLTTSIWPMRW